MLVLSAGFCAQERVENPVFKKNSYYLEFFGQGLYYSFNCDRLMYTHFGFKSSISAGLTFLPHPELFVVALPASYNVMYGPRNHNIELGIGFTPMFIQTKSQVTENWQDANGVQVSNQFEGTQNYFYTYLTPKIGYRLQKKDGGFFMRATFTPAVGLINIEGNIKGGHIKNTGIGHINFFGQTAFFPYAAVPWLGLSVGWTRKK